MDSPRLHDPNPPASQRYVAKRWTEKIAAKGWTPISDVFLENCHVLRPAITHREAMLIVHLMRHKWDEQPPFPSLKTIGKRMGITDKAAREICRSLTDKGYLRRELAVGSTNRFHLDGLFQAIEKVIDSQSPIPLPKQTETRRHKSVR